MKSALDLAPPMDALPDSDLPDLTPSDRGPVGQIETPAGPVDILAFVRLSRDEREVVMVHLADGSYAFHTQSWLQENGRAKASHSLRFTEKTLIMLLEALHLGSIYFGIDVEQTIRVLN